MKRPSKTGTDRQTERERQEDADFPIVEVLLNTLVTLSPNKYKPHNNIATLILALDCGRLCRTPVYLAKR